MSDPRRWRAGRKVGRTVYAQLAERPTDDDPLIGVMDTPELAADAVASHNWALSAGESSRPTRQLERCETSWGARHGECAVWLSEDTLCGKPLGHDPERVPHRGYDPSGSGRWIDYDAAGKEIGRGGPGGAW